MELKTWYVSFQGSVEVLIGQPPGGLHLFETTDEVISFGLFGWSGS